MRLYAAKLPDIDPEHRAPRRKETLEEYQQRAWDRPRQVLENMLSSDKYTNDRRPSEGTWSVSGDMVLVGTGQMGAGRTRNEIPDWILDDTASVIGQIGLKRSEVEDFLGRRLRRHRLLFWRRNGK